jgi:hypothetical protein
VPGYTGTGKWDKRSDDTKKEKEQMVPDVDDDGVGNDEPASKVPWIRSRGDRATSLKALLEEARKEGLLEYSDATIQWAEPDAEIAGDAREEEEHTRTEQKPAAAAEGGKDNQRGQAKGDEGEAFKTYIACEKRYRHSRKKWTQAVKACKDWDEYVQQLSDKLEAARSNQASKKEWADWWLDKYTVYQAEMEEASKRHKEQLVNGGEPDEEQPKKTSKATEECKDIFKDMEEQLVQQLEGVEKQADLESKGVNFAAILEAAMRKIVDRKAEMSAQLEVARTEAAAAKGPTKVKEEPLEPSKEAMGYAQQAAIDDIDLEEDDELAAAEKAKQAEMESRKGAGQANDSSSSSAAPPITGTIQ